MCPQCGHRWKVSGAHLQKLAGAAAPGFAYPARRQAAQAAGLFATGAAAMAAAVPVAEVVGIAANTLAPAGLDFLSCVGDVVGGAAEGLGQLGGGLLDSMGSVVGGIFGGLFGW
jgi:hypothetical protein